MPKQLPASVRLFAGRAAELRILNGLLGQPAGHSGALVISAIAGTAGVGKTALALHWAHLVADRFCDGQLYMNLRGYDPGQPVPPADALAGFLRALGVSGQQIPDGLDERAARYRSLLAGRRMLVVLDNARHADQVRPLLPGTSACTVVVTSRDPLAGLVARDGAVRIDLDLLPPADAISLLRLLIGRRAEADPAAAEALAAQCCRLPLALRIAAELAADRPDVTLTGLVAELADQQRCLDLLDASGDAHAALRTVFSWSYRHLDASAARAFRLASQHPGSDLDSLAIAALGGTSAEQAQQMLDALTRAHLVQPTVQGRYSMHDLLRSYARELSAAHDSQEERRSAMTRLLDHYMFAAAAAMDTLFRAERNRRPRIGLPVVTVPVTLSDPGRARAWLDSERANLVAAAVQAADHNWPGYATGLAATLHRYLDKGGYYPEAATIHACARRAAHAAGDRAAEATALVDLSTVDGHQSRYRQAASQLQEALALYRDLANLAGEARVLGNLGPVRFYEGYYREARGHLEAALALHRQTSDVAGQARVLANLGLIDSRQGRYGQAAGYLRQALAICQRVGNATGEAHALDLLGEIAMQQGRYLQATRLHQRALDLSCQAGDRAEQAQALCGLGLTELRQNHSQQAAIHLKRALELSREIGERDFEVQALNGLGELLLAEGQPGRARERYATALELAGEIRERYEQGRAHDGLGRTYSADGDDGQARRHWREALARYAELEVPEAEKIRFRLFADENGELQRGAGLQ